MRSVITIPDLSYTVKEGKPYKINAAWMKSSVVVASIFLKIFPDDGRERAGVLLLTDALNVVGYHEIGIGSIRGVDMPPAEVYRCALLTPACSGLIIAHTHPSGIVKPSDEDRKLAKQLSRAGDFLGVRLHDFLIVSHREVDQHTFFYSFDKERGKTWR